MAKLAEEGLGPLPDTQLASHLRLQNDLSDLETRHDQLTNVTSSQILSMHTRDRTLVKT